MNCGLHIFPSNLSSETLVEILIVPMMHGKHHFGPQPVDTVAITGVYCPTAPLTKGGYERHINLLANARKVIDVVGEDAVGWVRPGAMVTRMVDHQIIDSDQERDFWYPIELVIDCRDHKVAKLTGISWLHHVHVL
jgi:hypothetical protein